MLRLADFDVLLFLLVPHGLDSALERIALEAVAPPRRRVGLEDEVNLFESTACQVSPCQYDVQVCMRERSEKEQGTYQLFRDT